MSNIITTAKIAKKALLTIALVLGFFALVSFAHPAEAHAADYQKLMHAFTPHRDSVTGEMIARVNNASDMPYHGWICATEYTTSGRSYHRGCLMADLAPRWSGGEWSFQFGVMTKYGGWVGYSYQTSDGRWHSVMPAVK